jgi:hypothetical protein
MDKITTRHSVTVNSADVIIKNRIRRIKTALWMHAEERWSGDPEMIPSRTAPRPQRAGCSAQCRQSVSREYSRVAQHLAPGSLERRDERDITRNQGPSRRATPTRAALITLPQNATPHNALTDAAAHDHVTPPLCRTTEAGACRRAGLLHAPADRKTPSGTLSGWSAQVR